MAEHMSTIASQHKEIRAIIDHLDNGIELRQVTDALAKLESMCAEHFDFEETPSAQADIIESGAPNASERLKLLCADHPAILTEMRELRALVERCTKSGRALAAHIRAHEQAETELFTDSVYADEGGRG